MIKAYDNLPMILRLILQIFFGYIISPVYRIVAALSSKLDLLKLILYIILYIILAPLIWIIDIITIILSGKITFLVM